jgi:hypothetical protein
MEEKLRKRRILPREKNRSKFIKSHEKFAVVMNRGKKERVDVLREATKSVENADRQTKWAKPFWRKAVRSQKAFKPAMQIDQTIRRARLPSARLFFSRPGQEAEKA